MNPRSRRILTAMALAVVAWGLLAVFVHWQRLPGDHQPAMAVGAASFVAYLVAVGYVMHFRAHWAKPADGASDRRRLGPLARWMLTIVGVGGFSVAVCVLFPDIDRTYVGQLFLVTGVMGGIGIGLVATVSAAAPAESGVSKHRAEAGAVPPSFPRSAFRLVAAWVGIAAGTFVLFGPGYLVHREFRQRVDIPACERACVEHGAAFEGLMVVKSTYNCNCLAPEGRRLTFHDRAYIGGGQGFAAGLRDWAIRAAAILGAEVAWIAALIIAASRLGERVGGWLRVFHRSRRGHVPPGKLIR